MTTTTTTTASKGNSATTTDMPLRTKHLAAQFGMKPVALRRILRTMPQYADGVHTNYKWSEKDPAIPLIGAAIKKLAEEKAARAKAAKAALDARAAALALAAKADAKLA
jgi:hypothetical protein